ncbi:hypothetical protein G6F53_012717 [Rhizopus delemar]|nr:hypothetical protein G6F54_012677 [Rhizopus delemar]KAG1493645.1 hypothetical protein G6F53_012717 [Rhizopus delemar]
MMSFSYHPSILPETHSQQPRTTWKLTNLQDAKTRNQYIQSFQNAANNISMSIENNKQQPHDQQSARDFIEKLNDDICQAVYISLDNICGRIGQQTDPLKDFWTAEMRQAYETKEYYYRKWRKSYGLNKLHQTYPLMCQTLHSSALTFTRTLSTIGQWMRFFLRVLNTALREGKYPPTWQRSVIILLPKKGDRSQLKNWRPISLICADAKIFTRLLTTRLTRYLSDLIDPHQTGFMADIARRYKLPGVSLLLDQEKAYDRVHPDYLHACLTRFGLPPQLSTCITSLFFNTSICVNVNGFLSVPFS